MSAEDPDPFDEDSPDDEAVDIDFDGDGIDHDEDGIDFGDEDPAFDDGMDELAADTDDVGGEAVDLDSDFDDLEPGNEFESLEGEGEFGDIEEDFDDAREFDDTGEEPDSGMEFDESAGGLDDEMDFDEPSDVAPSGDAGDAGKPVSRDDDGSFDEPSPTDGGAGMSDGVASAPDDAESDGESSSGESSGPDRATIEGLQGEQLADILSQAWVNRGWETDVAEDDDGSFFVTGDQGNGQRGLILVLPGDVEVPGKRLQQYASLVKKKDVDVRVVATQGEFTDDAERIAKANNVHLLDPQAILETVEAEGLESELSRFASENGGGDGGGGGGIGAMIPGIPIPAVGLPGGVPLPSPGGKGLKSVLVIVLIATSLLAGFAGGAFLGPGGSAGGGAVAAAMDGFAGGGGDDVAVASLSTAEPGSAGLTVHWNARTAGSVVANGSTYEAPDESRFVVVELVVQNTGDDRVPVKSGDFLVNANGTRYTHQPLDGTRTFEMTAVAPENETTGWLVFAIPDDVNDAVLVPDPEAAGGPVTFVRNSSLTINGTG